MSTDRDLRPVEGWHAGLPRVELNEYVAATLGMPEVQFDGLDELFGEELALPQEKFPAVALVGSPHTATSDQLARYKKREQRVEIDAIAIQTGFPEEERNRNLTEALAHESYHHMDAVNHPLRTRFENWGPADLSVAAATIGTTVETIPLFWSMIIVGGALVAGKTVTLSEWYYRNNPYEKRAIAFATRSDIAAKYGSIIRFDT
jgi:hypothetical protein